MWTLALVGREGTITPLDLELSEEKSRLIANRLTVLSGVASFPIPRLKAAAIWETQALDADVAYHAFAIDVVTLDVARLPDVVFPKWFETWKAAFHADPTVPQSTKICFVPA